jgi:hypothetical protein
MLTRNSRAAALLALSTLGACADPVERLMSPDTLTPAASTAPPPAHLASVEIGGGTHAVWPYTGTNLFGIPQDPINLVFTGNSDPRNVRNALLSLSGDRTGAPFNASPEGMLLAGIAQGCSWTDAFGDNQTSYSGDDGWAGSVIQLECGGYNNFRFHLRLFPAGTVTLGNVHAEVIIPGTQQHEVLTWEAAEKFVVMELLRGGLLTAPPAETGIINETEFYKSIMVPVYNGIPDGHPLRMLSGGPLSGPVSSPVPVRTDGKATVLTLATAPAAPSTEQNFTIHFGQSIPKPFCAPSGEWVRVDGPVQVSHHVHVSGDGKLTSKGVAKGTLTVRSVDLATGALGPATFAKVEQEYENEIERGKHRVTTRADQRLDLGAGRTDAFSLRLRVGSGGEAVFTANQSCGA